MGTPSDFTDDVINYVPNADFVGTEVLIYSISDGVDVDRGVINIQVGGTQTTSSLVTGSVHKGAVAGALVTLYEVSRDGLPQLDKMVVAATSEQDGSWVVRLQDDQDDLIAVSQGGIFIDEADPDQTLYWNLIGLMVKNIFL